MTTVYMRTARTAGLLGQKNVSVVPYSGTVWCPTTLNGTWLAQRNGTSYWTGNCKTMAVNRARAKAHGDVYVILDADCYISGDIIADCAARIRKARRQGHRLWFVPYRHFFRLTPGATYKLVQSDPVHPYRFPSPPPAGDVEGREGSSFGHWFGALIQIMPREAFDMAGGMDKRFRGWGGEDVSFMHAVDTLYSRHKTTDNDVLHLWHQKEGNLWRDRKWEGQAEPGTNDALSWRYYDCRGDRERMQRLVDEGTNAEYKGIEDV
jgi:predicted glycosyltransferase involved in capsule biosynthesis